MALESEFLKMVILMHNLSFLVYVGPKKVQKYRNYEIPKVGRAPRRRSAPAPQGTPHLYNHVSWRPTWRSTWRSSFYSRRSRSSSTAAAARSRGHSHRFLQKRSLFWVLSLCLFRACLGKMVVLSNYKIAQKDAFPYRHQADCCASWCACGCFGTCL